MLELFSHEFQQCRVSIDPYDSEGWNVPGLAVVTFHDGTFTTARPHTTPEYHDHARRAGYGENIAAFTIEHELAHAFLAEQLGRPYSQVQWDDAHGVKDLPVIIEEERFVRHFQRYANLGRVNLLKVAVLVDAGLDLDVLVERWEALIVETFGRLRWFADVDGGKQDE